MTARLLDRQHSLLAYLTSGEAIFADQRQKPAEPSLRGIDPGLLHLEARFSHEKRMEKIAGVFARTLALLGNQRTEIEHAFADKCPPTAIGRLENAHQFFDFLCGQWEQWPPDPEYLPDLARCELGFAQARSRDATSDNSDSDQPVHQVSRARPGAVRRDPGVVLLRCAYDIRILFETGFAEPAPARRDVALAIATATGAREPAIFELKPAIFDLLAALDGWTDRRAFGATRKARAMVADLVSRGLLEERL
ncbi:MAG: hypothetical protein JO230_09585 [Xanthobacteraceae bacterium]|nr:hypothetical protein [Xanthobacteraceae bacterium]